MKKLLFVLLVLFQMNNVMAQFGLSGGVSMLKAFGVPKPYVGLHIGGEIPRDDEVTFYGRMSFYGKQRETLKGTTTVTAYDFTTNPYNMTVQYQSSMNYTIIEGGSRYYIGNGYDSGFGAYGGSNLMIVFNSVKRDYDDYDQTLYQLNPGELAKGSIFNLGFGLGGGVKNTFAGLGTLYLDLNLSYMLMNVASNTTAVNTNLYSPLLFTFNFGFRKEFY